MKKNLIFIVALLYTVGAFGLFAAAKTNDSSINKVSTSVSRTVTKENKEEETHAPNMVAILEGDKLVDWFPFVHYTIKGDKIRFDKLRVAYEKGMPCPIPGSSTGEYNLSDCRLYYSELDEVLAEKANTGVMSRYLVG